MIRLLATIFITGTGKSETGAHIAYTFAMANRQLSPPMCVLYCGPSNKSVDVVLGKLPVHMYTFVTLLTMSCSHRKTG